MPLHRLIKIILTQLPNAGYDEFFSIQNTTHIVLQNLILRIRYIIFYNVIAINLKRNQPSNGIC